MKNHAKAKSRGKEWEEEKDGKHFSSNQDKGQSRSGRATKSDNEEGLIEKMKNSGEELIDEKIMPKLEQLQEEWSLERIMKVAGAGAIILGVFLGVKHRKKLENFAESLAELLGVESLEEWTPPAGILKKFGIRTQDEINREISSLKTGRRRNYEHTYNNEEDMQAA